MEAIVILAHFLKTVDTMTGFIKIISSVVYCSHLATKSPAVLVEVISIISYLHQGILVSSTVEGFGLTEIMDIIIASDKSGSQVSVLVSVVIIAVDSLEISEQTTV